MPHPTLGSILLASNDPDRLKEWYEQAFDVKPNTDGFMEFGGTAVLVDRRSDVASRNAEPPNRRTAEPQRIILNFHVDDAHAVAAHLEYKRSANAPPGSTTAKAISSPLANRFVERDELPATNGVLNGLRADPDLFGPAWARRTATSTRLVSTPAGHVRASPKVSPNARPITPVGYSPRTPLGGASDADMEWRRRGWPRLVEGQAHHGRVRRDPARC